MSSSESRRKALILPVGLSVLATAGAAVLSSGAFFTDSTSIGGNSFTAGWVSISTNPTTQVFDAANMAPGDVVTMPLTVRNDGSLELRYSMTSTASGPLADALTLQVKAGVTNCSNDGFSADGTTLYGESSPIGTSDGMKVLGDVAQGPQAGDRILAAGEQERLCFQVVLPGASTGNNYQTGEAHALFTFVGEQTASND